MISDFINDLQVTENEKTLSAGVIRELTFFIGIEPFELSKSFCRLLPKEKIEARLGPLVLGLLGLEEQDRRYSERNRRKITIIRDWYGIGAEQLSVSQISKKYGLATREVKRIIDDKMSDYRDSDDYISWQYFLAVSMYLNKSDFGRFCEVVVNDTENQKEYRDLRLLSRCLKNAGLPRR